MKNGQGQSQNTAVAITYSAVSFYITRSSVTLETRHCVLYIYQMLKHQHTVEKFVLIPATETNREVIAQINKPNLPERKRSRGRKEQKPQSEKLKKPPMW